MKFSVLIAHYNNAEYFKECYESLLQQTYQNWEAIILDDASEEEEKTLVKKSLKEITGLNILKILKIKELDLQKQTH